MDISETGHFRDMDISVTWTFQKHGHFKEMDISEQWPFQRHGHFRDMDIAETWKFQRHGHFNFIDRTYFKNRKSRRYDIIQLFCLNSNTAFVKIRKQVNCIKNIQPII